MSLMRSAAVLTCRVSVVLTPSLHLAPPSSRRWLVLVRLMLLDLRHRHAAACCRPGVCAAVHGQHTACP